MIWQLDLILLVLTVVCALGAITLKDLLGSTILLGAFGFFMCLLWVEMGAVDETTLDVAQKPVTE